MPYETLLTEARDGTGVVTVNRPEVRNALNRRVMRKLKGYRFNYLLESIDEPGEAISVTAWDTMDDAEAYEQSGLYADLVTKFGKWFTAPAELRTYEVSE